ncbi:extracellular solute-binding protein [Rhizobium sp. TRM95111]|uniref:extracellular solute-binding protein n=1 Tax=Rhizobium alarense TaxID=2846851 RepID=UPI001F2A481A|nr:extracellular solute-binding protein [Rhizobium alarense]MCF3638808.1 extracellular solute-binding protein [Rhizobium alarense]
MTVTLKGMTWSHPRGYDPMVACSRIWRDRTGVSITWEKRSLQDFETFPVQELARIYDLIVIDHPHVGQITAEECLAPLDVTGRESERAALSTASVGRSYESYAWKGRQWAFPIDVATQVQVFRPDLIKNAPATWDEVLSLARNGRVLLPLRPPHSLMSFFTLCGGRGTPCNSGGAGDLVDRNDGAAALEMLRQLAALVEPACFEMDPIAVLERMSDSSSRIAAAPLIYGYVSYAHERFRPERLLFRDLPAIGAKGPAGSALGGTGIAVSAHSACKEAAIDFAYWIAGREAQRGPYAANGGQPGHADAWEDETVNTASGDFYRGTRQTLETAWLRPRHDGYMAFQQAGSERINEGLVRREAGVTVVDDLNRLFRRSFGER